ncbi:Myb DNA-bind 3 domain-containing protein [Abeliophyllum distichum]|uniref:Myb DNA-bind 3 domain-containing protein n=1 Tax=Abeliophyllum distichum TaxID=126358 RepID=A0ABD1UJB6_9LAMI
MAVSVEFPKIQTQCTPSSLVIVFILTHRRLLRLRPPPVFRRRRYKRAQQRYSGNKETDKHQRRSAKWDDDTHRIFVNCCEILIAKGYRQGKCFTKTGWQQLVSMFNHEDGKDWKCSQLKNHWFNMRREYLLLHEILRSTGIEYDHQDNTIVADDWWWERKIQCEKSDKLPVNAEMRDEHAPSEHAGSGSAMDMSGFHSGEKRKCSYGAMKGKKKLGSRSALSESVEKLATVGNELIASHLKANSEGSLVG